MSETKVPPKKRHHYVNNAEFLAAIKERKELIKQAEAEGKPKPPLTNYLGECILKIATHISYKPNFIGYTFKDEMISDGIENCLLYFDNFDPEKSSNPFAYYSQFIHFAFIRRIQREKKQTLIKGKIVMEMPFDAFELQDHDEDGSYTSSYAEFMRESGVFDEVARYDEALIQKSKKRKQAQLDSLFEDE